MSSLYKIAHPAIASSVFELVKTSEFDLILGEESFSIRFELFQDTERKDHFRRHIWELESFRLTPTFPMDNQGQPQDISDDIVMVERSTKLSQSYDDFIAPDPDTALNIVLEELKQRLEQCTGEKAT
ncbi:MAG TPA: hypothetical protein VHT73_12510 [Thermodesulfobacteriota bacterium]|nr:hypothetical protein [Thermodesulfobacteriota bacterium]